MDSVVSGRRLRVRFDSEIFGSQLHGGVSRYYAELIRALPANGVDPTLIVPLTFNRHLNRASEGVWAGQVDPRYWSKVSHKVAQGFSVAADRFSAALGKYDVFHQTWYSLRYNDVPNRVVTVHDMIPELLPDDVSMNSHAGKLASFTTASLVLTVSENTRQDLLALHPELNCPIEVTPLGVDLEYFRGKARGQEGNTILFVGSRRGYKNFPIFAQATSKLLKSNPCLSILCVGGGSLSEAELAPYIERDVASRIRQRTVSDAQLPEVYRTALCFVFPSRYEGFGLPMLEAFACGCPVVAAKASCFPEIAGEAAEYFDPLDSNQLLEVLTRVCSDRARRQHLRAQGVLRAADFSWHRTAQLTADAYRTHLSFPNCV